MQARVDFDQRFSVYILTVCAVHTGQPSTFGARLLGEAPAGVSQNYFVMIGEFDIPRKIF